MLNGYEYYMNFNWTSNPFILSISPELMVGYSSQLKSLLSHIFNSHKVGVLIGPTGSGKTTILHWLNNFINNKENDLESFYIAKPPRDKGALISLFKNLMGYNVFDKIKFWNLGILNLTDFLISKSENKKILFLVDEAHESSIEVLEWIRTLVDNVPNMQVIFAGLPVFEKIMETKLPTLHMRITSREHLISLNEIETESLIRKRIEHVNGTEIHPFSHDAIKRIYEITGGFPREIIKTCNTLVQEAAGKNISSISPEFVDESLNITHVEESSEIVEAILSKKQKKILKLLNENSRLSPADVVERLELNEYKSRNNAVRSINNILRRLMKDELLVRKKRGNCYIYSLSGKAKTIFTEA